MKTKLALIKRAALLLLLSALNPQLSTARAQGTAFTYQGRLNSGSNPANGTYDLQFAIYDSTNQPGTVIAGPLTNSATGVTNGLFAVTLDFGANVFTGPDRWLEIAVRTNGSGEFTTLSPRQKLTPTPYAVFAITASNLSGALPATQLSGVVPSASLSGTYSNAVTLNNPNNNFSGAFTGNGANLTNVNAATVGGLAAAAFWKTNGNAGANPTNGAFLGTIDNLPLELRVNGTRALRLEPRPNDVNHSNTVNVVCGSPNNFVSNNVYGATIAGGGAASSTLGSGQAGPNVVSTDFGVIGGGLGNTIQIIGDGAVIGGGMGNTIQPGGEFAVIGGGVFNTNSGTAATVGGGWRNVASGNGAVVSGGGWTGFVVDGNVASGAASVVGGGLGNVASGGLATVPGGSGNIASGAYSLAAGSRAHAANQGAFVWADSQSGTFTSVSNDQFLVRAAAGVGINTNSPAATLDVNGTARVRGVNNWDVNNTEGDFRVGNDTHRFKIGVATAGGGAGDVWMRAQGGTQRVFFKTPGGTTIYSDEAQLAGVSLAAGSGTWTDLSDRNAKENFSPVNGREILEKVASLPLSTWNYRSEPAAFRHLGPMAQDFKAAFGLGETDTGITTVDADGVALAAIQGLNEKVEAGSQKSEVRIQKLEAENAELKQRLAALEKIVCNQKLN